jgi:hypothetical protein
MNPFYIRFTLFLLSGIQSFALAQETAADEKGFSLVKEKDNVFIYERWIFFPKSDPPVEAREVKSEFYAHATIDEAFALLRNESKIKQWQSHVSKFKVFPQTDSTWYEYSYHDIPWPVSDQDHFLIYEIEENIPGERIFVTFESLVHSLGPVDDDAARMKLAGSWLYETQGDKIKITYRILSMPSNIPRIFTDPVIRNNMMSTIKSYVKLLEEKK